MKILAKKLVPPALMQKYHPQFFGSETVSVCRLSRGGLDPSRCYKLSKDGNFLTS
jgi:hypothetical protein